MQDTVEDTFVVHCSSKHCSSQNTVLRRLWNKWALRRLPDPIHVYDVESCSSKSSGVAMAPPEATQWPSVTPKKTL